MVDRGVVVRPAATSWGAVLGGWIATIGASVIFAPVVAGLVAAVGAPSGANQLALAVPVVLGVRSRSSVRWLLGVYRPSFPSDREPSLRGHEALPDAGRREDDVREPRS